MNPYEMIAFVVLMVSVAGVLIVNRIYGAGRHSLAAAQQIIEELQLRLQDAERHNDELRQQLEWNKRLLEAQDRVLQQLGPGQASKDVPGTPLSRV